MEVILIEGKKDAGKTTTCLKIENWLELIGFQKIDRIRTNEPHFDDFVAIYKHVECNTTIIINSGSDMISLIKEFEKFFNKHESLNYDILISAIRPEGTYTSGYNVHDEIKKVYTSDDFSASETTIELDNETELSTEDYIKVILLKNIPLIFDDLKTKLHCNLIFKEESLNIFK